MANIALDLSRLLGFKIVATAGSPAKLRSPKIGDKGCPSFDTAAAIAIGAPVRPEIGSKN